MNTLGDYPPGAANDPRAPWNEPEPETHFCSCGEPAEYYKIIERRFPDGMPFDEYIYYCVHCLDKRYKNYIEQIRPDAEHYGDPLPTFEDFLNDENIEQL